MWNGYWSTRSAPVMTTAMSALRPPPQPNRVAFASSRLVSWPDGDVRRDTYVSLCGVFTVCSFCFAATGWSAVTVVAAVASLHAAVRLLERAVRHAATPPPLPFLHFFPCASTRPVPARMLIHSVAALCCSLQALSLAMVIPEHQIFPGNCLRCGGGAEIAQSV
jgi:hypothetical protein